MTGLLPLVAISGPRAGRAPCARRRVTWTSGDPLRILRPRESSQLEVIRPDAGPRCARGPQHPRATHGPSTHEASSPDVGHGRPGTAEPAGSRWVGKADDGDRNRQRRPARPGSTWCTETAPGGCGGGEFPATGHECHRRRPRELRELSSTRSTSTSTRTSWWSVCAWSALGGVRNAATRRSRTTLSL